MGLLPTWDTYEIKRPVATSDSEGNSFNGVITVGVGSGVWGSASVRDQANAAKRDQLLDAFIATADTRIQIADIVTVRGHTYTVVSIKDVRLHFRVGLRITDERAA